MATARTGSVPEYVFGRSGASCPRYLCIKMNVWELVFCEVRPNGILGIAHAGVREARSRMALRMHRHLLSVVRSWKARTGARMWKRSGVSPSPRTTEDRRFGGPKPPLFARIEARACLPSNCPFRRCAPTLLVGTTYSVGYVRRCSRGSTISVREPHSNTNPSALTHGRCTAWVRHSSDPTVDPPHGTGIHPGYRIRNAAGGARTMLVPKDLRGSIGRRGA
jgi:hypothetical protein